MSSKEELNLWIQKHLSASNISNEKVKWEAFSHFFSVFQSLHFFKTLKRPTSRPDVHESKQKHLLLKGHSTQQENVMRKNWKNCTCGVREEMKYRSLADWYTRRRRLWKRESTKTHSRVYVEEKEYEHLVSSIKVWWEGKKLTLLRTAKINELFPHLWTHSSLIAPQNQLKDLLNCPLITFTTFSVRLRSKFLRVQVKMRQPLANFSFLKFIFRRFYPTFSQFSNVF